MTSLASRSALVAILVSALVRPVGADGHCSADWQCPHGTTCQANTCAPAPGGSGSASSTPTPGSQGGGTAGNGGAARGGGAGGGGGGANGGGAGGGANGGAGNAGGANGGGAGGGANGGGAGGGAHGGGANGGGGNGGGANGGGGNAGGANGGGGNGGGANAGAGNAGGANGGGGGNAGGANAGGGNGGGANGGGANAGGAGNGGGANGAGNGDGANGGGANGGGAHGGGGNAGGGANGNSPYAGGGTPYGGGAQGPGGPYGEPGQPFSIQLVVEGANDVRDNAHAQYKPGSKVKLSVIARDAHGNVVSGCEPVFEIAENSDADAVPHGALGGNEVTFLHDGKFSIFAHCKNNPNITTRGEHNNFNFETSSSQFASCTNTPECNACVGGCDINALEDKARKANGDTPKHAGVSPAEVILILGLAGLVVYGAYHLAGGGNYCFDITSSNNGSCPPDHYCFGSQSDCESNLAQTMAICTCHVAQCTVNFSGCGASAREGIHDVSSLVASGFAAQRRTTTARLAPQTSSPETISSHTSTRAIVIGAALGAAAVATTGYLLWRELRGKPSRVEIVPWVGPGGAGITAMGRF